MTSAPRGIVVVLLCSLAGCKADGPAKQAPAGTPVEAKAAPATPAAEDGLEEVTPIPGTGTWTPLPWLAGSVRVAAVRSNGTVTIFAGGLGWVRAFDASGKRKSELQRPGMVQFIDVADIDGDGSMEVLAAFGIGRGALDAKLTLWAAPASALASAVEVPLPETSRQQLVGAVVTKANRLITASFVSKYMVEIGAAVAAAKGWTRSPGITIRMPWAVAAHGDRLFVARPYGETQDALGDAFELVGDTRKALPAIMGARAVVAGASFVAMADGWHKSYKQNAKALITWMRPEDDQWIVAGRVRVAGRSGFDTLRIANIDGDGRADLVAAGDGSAVWVSTAGPNVGVPFQLGSEVAADAYPFDIDGDGVDEVLVVGDHPGIWQRKTSPQP